MYCVSCKKYAGNENSSVKKKFRQNRWMLLSNCANCGQKWTFIKNKELHNFNNIWDD